ncbi:threonine--tRNA ligase [Patescibacteria group bacterium]|nr:threonine--tRNA ligase [Patescibacteria group bacterium]MBU1034331.1 threonine--tRNA ligase [Patescibacteria group bacterium]MBU1629959.1 threonine--tRNA ligase [Patescibacteria group bacterium]MBU1907702.1 threonine--tRNA ligase [Patescibacteria group bacterium]
MDFPIETRRHSAAHVMAAAIQRLFPNAKFGVGPAVEYGFYYDVDIGRAVTPEDLGAIEKEMRKIIAENPEFKHEEMSLDEAIALFESLSQSYKVELLNDLKTKGTTKMSLEDAQDLDTENPAVASIYRTGQFVDLCRGPHVGHASEIGAWKLTKVAGAYWRGNAENPQMQRIYGWCFDTQAELEEHQKMMEEAEKRDHRVLGQALGLFTFHAYAPGIPFFLPKGMAVRNELVKFVHEVSYGEGYQEVQTPQIFDCELWKTSGHWEHYRGDMFTMTVDEREMAVKPMNCPAHMLIFNMGLHSYRELPIRLAETTMLHRYELSGTLGGLARARAFAQDDTHIFARQSQVQAEVLALLERVRAVYEVFQLTIAEAVLSTRPEKFMGEAAQWDRAEDDLQKALTESGLPFGVIEGEGAFYGPKIDIRVKDVIGRKWQLATIQLDFQMPQRFELSYVEENGSRQTPVVIHRAILGSIERFLSILIEHYAGAFPLWLSPEQVRVLPVAERHEEFAASLASELHSHGLRAECDASKESVGKKVRNAEKDKVPVMLVVGDKEADGDVLTVRRYGQEDQQSIAKNDLIKKLLEEIKNRK